MTIEDLDRMEKTFPYSKDGQTYCGLCHSTTCEHIIKMKANSENARNGQSITIPGNDNCVITGR